MNCTRAIPFTLYTSNFCFNSGFCHLQKFSDNLSMHQKWQWGVVQRTYGELFHMVQQQSSKAQNQQDQIEERRWRGRTQTSTLVSKSTMNWTGLTKQMPSWVRDSYSWWDSDPSVCATEDPWSACSSQCTILCCGDGIRAGEASSLNKLAWKTSSVVRLKLNTQWKRGHHG